MCSLEILSQLRKLCVNQNKGKIAINEKQCYYVDKGKVILQTTLNFGSDTGKFYKSSWVFIDLDQLEKQIREKLNINDTSEIESLRCPDFCIYRRGRCKKCRLYDTQDGTICPKCGGAYEREYCETCQYGSDDNCDCSDEACNC